MELSHTASSTVLKRDIMLESDIMLERDIMLESDEVSTGYGHPRGVDDHIGDRPRRQVGPPAVGAAFQGRRDIGRRD